MSSSPQPFKVSIPDTDLAQLRDHLALTRLPDELDEAGWHYGAPLADVKRLVARWRDGYDWRVHEEEINKLPQFLYDIGVDGFGVLKVHYVHQRSEVVDAIPLLFVHGCTSIFGLSADGLAELILHTGPGHFLEVQKILPLLTAASPSHPSFHVVALSLPGFGFSEAPRKRGFKGAQYAEVRKFHLCASSMWLIGARRLGTS